MTKIGIVGLGFMGKMHLRCYRGIEGVEVAAVCDVDAARLTGTGAGGGNIEGAEEQLDLSGVGQYDNLATMLAETKLDAVSITLPTYLHGDATVAALEAGLDVLCEKPMALTTNDAQRMIAAANRTGRRLQIGHCIRFWPEYEKAKELLDSGRYGRVLAATFQRLSLTPGWAWDGWLMDPARSGAAAVDLHIHDSDFVQYALGMPRAVFSRASSGPSGGPDHIVTQYIYDDDRVVTAEGGWAMSPSFGFEMSFNIVAEKATIVFDLTRDPAFRVCPVDGDPEVPEVAPGDGYSREIEHFIAAVRGETVPEVLTPEQSAESLRLVLAECESAESGRVVEIA